MTQTDLYLVCASRSEVGRRSANEDNVFVDEDAGLYVICDGAGGAMGGRTAAQLVCRTIDESADDIAVQVGPALGPNAEAVMDAVLRQAHERVLEGQSSDPRLSEMTTTVAMVLHRGGQLLLTHVGDSRIYLLREGELRQMTRDHSLENYLKDHPEYRPKVKQPGKVLVRALGLRSRHLQAEHRRLELQPGDVLLICTDGLSDAVSAWTLREIVAGAAYMSVDEVSACLVRAALSHGTMDNISVALLKASDRPHAEPRTAVLEPTPSFAQQAGVALGWLAFVQGAHRGEIVPLEGSTVIGADPGCRIVIDDGYVSSHHIEILRTPEGFILRDLGSTNGTHINNVRVPSNEEEALVDGDVVRVGKTEMMFKCERVEVP